MGEVFHYPSLVAEWGLAHFDSELEIARKTIARLRAEDPAAAGATGSDAPR